MPFLLHGAMHSADYAVARCPSIRPSVRPSHADILSKRLNISSNFLQSRFSTYISFYLGNDTT